MAQKKENKKEHPYYYVTTPLETLYDEGLTFNSFDGDMEKDKMINFGDFCRLREHIQRVDPSITPDIREMLIRYLKLNLKEPA